MLITTTSFISFLVFSSILILSILMAIEASTSIARRVGYDLGQPAAGLIFQSSLALLSRFLTFLFMPLIGYLADSGGLASGISALPFYFLMVPMCLWIVQIKQKKISHVYRVLILRVLSSGSLFRRRQDEHKEAEVSAPLGFQKKSFLRKKMLSFYALVALIYIPYYTAWPVVILIISNVQDYRATTLGLATVFTGVNTVALTIWIDPKLAQIGRHRLMISGVYDALLTVRMYAAIIASVLVFLAMLLS